MRVPRVLVATAALSLGLVPAAACSNSNRPGGSAAASASASTSGSGPAGQGAPGAAGSGAPGGGTATGSDKQVCAEQERLVADSTRKFGEEVVKAAQGGGEQAAVAAVKTLFADWAMGMRTQAGKAQSAELKGALTDYAAGLEKVNSQINGVQDLDKLGDLNTAEIEAATDKILRICG